MDITFDISDKHFNYRVSALITFEDKLLVIKDNRAGYFFLPGGHVKIGETNIVL